MRCRLCDRETALLGGREDVTLHRCLSCGFVSGRPVVEASAAERYHDYYAGSAPPAPVMRYDEWITRAEKTVGRGRLLEVGAGAGGFVRAARERGWHVRATEVSQTGVETLRAGGIETFPGDVADARFEDGAFDFLAALEVLEHLERPALHLREWARVVRPGGLLLVTTPNYRGLTGRALHLRWRVVASEHLGYFTRRTLDAAIQAAGFREVHTRSRGLDVFGWKTDPSAERPPAFDPARAAAVRERIDRARPLHAAKEAVHALLGALHLGDTLLAWARR